MENVVSARLGLMEILHPNGNSEFTYTVGIKCSSDEQNTIQQAVEVLRSVPCGTVADLDFSSNQSVFHERGGGVLW